MLPQVINAYFRRNKTIESIAEFSPIVNALCTFSRQYNLVLLCIHANGLFSSVTNIRLRSMHALEQNINCPRNYVSAVIKQVWISSHSFPSMNSIVLENGN